MTEQQHTMPGIGPRNLRLADFRPNPIRREWVISGSPRARATELVRSPDGTLTAAQWECTAGTFHWYFWVEETVHVLDGEVLVRDSVGRHTLLRAGDIAVMPANSWAIWHVERYVRKLAICRYPVPWPLGALLRAVQRLRTELGLRRVPHLRRRDTARTSTATATVPMRRGA